MLVVAPFSVVFISFTFVVVVVVVVVV